jgi:hypothetical protein
MNFEFSDSQFAQGTIIYIAKDRAFQTLPAPSFASSIQINEIELLLEQNGRIVGLSGYCPHDGWEKAVLHYPLSKPGAVRCSNGLDPDGIPIRLNRNERWRVLHDSEAEVVYISALSSSRTTTTVEILKGLTLGLEQGHLTQIWIRLPSIVLTI